MNISSSTAMQHVYCGP